MPLSFWSGSMCLWRASGAPAHGRNAGQAAAAHPVQTWRTQSRLTAHHPRAYCAGAALLCQGRFFFSRTGAFASSHASSGSAAERSSPQSQSAVSSSSPYITRTVSEPGTPVRAFYDRAGGQSSASHGAVLTTGTVLSHMAGTVYAVQLNMRSTSPSSSATLNSPQAHKGEGRHGRGAWLSPVIHTLAAFWRRNLGNTQHALHDDDDAAAAACAGLSASASSVQPPLALSPVISVGCRVFIEYGGKTHRHALDETSAMSETASHQHQQQQQQQQPQLVGGVVVRVNANRTIAVLLDDNNLDLAVPQTSVRLCLGRGSYVDSAERRSMMAWLRAAGVPRRGDRELLGALLSLRGWTTSRLYLLEASDLHLMPLISKSVRLCVLEKAEWERDHHKQMRQLLKEKVKERDFRYRITKYSGVISASMAFLGIAVAFAWNAKNFRRQQRGYQLRLATETLTAVLDQSESRTSSHTTTTGLREEQCVQSPPLPPHQAAHVTTYIDAEPIVGGEAAPVAPFTRMERPEEESTLRRVLRLLDSHHPRVIVVTGVYGSGKKTLCQYCIEAEKVPALYVDVRDNEDTLRSIVRALGVENVDVCGDLLDLVAEACRTATRLWTLRHPSNPAIAKGQAGAAAATTERDVAAGTAPLSSSSPSYSKVGGHDIPNRTNAPVPLVVLKLQHSTGLKKVYNEAVALACDRRVCHIMILLPLESLTMANLTMPRLDFYMVPIFNERQAFQYTQHAIDPVSLRHFIETIGTNGNDLDELFAAVHQRQVPANEHTVQMLQRAMHQLSEACQDIDSLQQAILQLALLSFDEGQHTAVASSGLLRHPALSRIVLYDPVKDAWVFRSRMYHTAARCLWQLSNED